MKILGAALVVLGLAGSAGANAATSIDHGRERNAANMPPVPGWPWTVSTTIHVSIAAHASR